MHAADMKRESITHPWALHASQMFNARFALPRVAYFAISPFMIALMAVPLYFAVGKTSIRLRDLFWPRHEPRRLPAAVQIAPN